MSVFLFVFPEDQNSKGQDFSSGSTLFTILFYILGYLSYYQ